MDKIAILRAQIEVLKAIRFYVQGLINDRVTAIWESEKEAHEAEFGYGGHEDD